MLSVPGERKKIQTINTEVTKMFKVIMLLNHYLLLIYIFLNLNASFLLIYIYLVKINPESFLEGIY